MKQLLILGWILWVQMFFAFGSTSVYFVRTHYYAYLAVTAPVFLVVLFFGWRLFLKTRRDWNREVDGPVV